MIKYMGTRKSPEGSTLYVFVVNGQQKQIREFDLKLHPGCYDVLPQSVKDQIVKNRQWLSKV